MSSGKGSGYERDLCRRLTAWWTGDPDLDTIFWRTAGSGARATSRLRAGKQTSKAHCGDIAAIDPIGQPLLDWMALESKRGYNQVRYGDLVTKHKSDTLRELTAWIRQAEEARQNSGARGWGIIHRPDRSAALLIQPTKQLGMLRWHLNCPFRPHPLLELAVVIDGKERELTAVPLELFFECFDRGDILAILTCQTGADKGWA